MSSWRSEIESSIKEFLAVPQILKKQIRELAPTLRQDEYIGQRYAEFKHRTSAGEIPMDYIQDRKDRKRLLLWACLLRYVSALQVAQPQFLPFLQCYDQNKKPIIQLDELVTSHSCMKLFSGHFI